MRRGPVIVFLVLLAAGSGAWLLLRRAPAGTRCNVLMVSIDTCRADRMGFLGGSRFTQDGRSPTPELDALAGRCLEPREGLSPVPLTLPAHVSVLSGLLPDASGVRENDSFSVPPRSGRGYSLLAEDLRAAGYDTAAFVSGQPLERAFGLDAGFRTWIQPTRADDPEDDLRFRERSCEATTGDVLKWIADAGDGPWFAFVHYFDPHHPYDRRPDVTGMPDGAAGDYLAEIAAVDRQIGRLLRALPDGGRGTLVIVFSDHGEGLGEHGEETHGFLLHDATLRVPVLVKLPERMERPAAAPVPPRLIDLQPTVLDVTGVAALDDVPRDGRSLLDPAPASWNAAAETLYPYYQFHHARLRAYRDAGHKLVEGGGAEEVFAWRADPGELEDLAPRDGAAVTRLRRGLFEHLARPRPGTAEGREVVPSAAVPYFGGRPLSLPVEPAEDENRSLVRTSGDWALIGDLDLARARIRERRPAEAAWLLARRESEAAGNPSLLFWWARAEDLSGRDRALGLETRAGHLDRALDLYTRHAQRWDDGRSTDALIRLRLTRHEALGRREELDEALRLADAEIARGRGRALTHALRATGRERAGNPAGAAEDFAEAVRLDPDDPRHRENLARLRRREG